NGIKLVEAVVAIGGREELLQRIIFFEVGDQLAEIQFVAVEAKRLRNAKLLPIKDHRRAVNRTANGITNQGLKRIGVAFLVVRSVIQQYQPLTIRAAARFEDVTIIG